MEEAIEKYTEALGVDEENDVLRATLYSNRASAYLRVRLFCLFHYRSHLILSSNNS